MLFFWILNWNHIPISIECLVNVFQGCDFSRIPFFCNRKCPILWIVYVIGKCMVFLVGIRGALLIQTQNFANKRIYLSNVALAGQGLTCNTSNPLITSGHLLCTHCKVYFKNTFVIFMFRSYSYMVIFAEVCFVLLTITLQEKRQI